MHMAIILKERLIGRPKCIMCNGDMERATLGNICNSCKDKMHR